MYGPDVGGGGLGRYVEQMVIQLQQLDRENRYVLFLKKENFDACPITAPNFEKRLADVHWYTVKEQLAMPGIIDRERLDLVHFPHWNVPLLVRTPFVVTIHDLILLEQPTSAKATTRGPIVYPIKRLGYRIVLANALRRSRQIIAVSNYTKSSILKFFPSVPAEKISVIYEGVTALQPSQPLQPLQLFLLYVGNAYPHKNLDTLLAAFDLFVQKHPKYKLVLAGRDDMFYRRLQGLRGLQGLQGRVRFVMNPPDEELADLYRGATGYVFPSRSEGFGLPPLEAMSAGIPVTASDIGALTEVLGDAALYFSPNDPREMAAAMSRLVSDENLRRLLIAKGHEQTERYSWKTMVEQTLAIYGKLSHSKTK